MIPSRLSLITIGVRDVRSLRAFYEGLGWKSNTPETDEFAAFPLGGAVFCLFRLDLLAGEANLPTPADDGAFKGFTLAINVEEIEQVDAALQAAQEGGARPLAEPVTRDWGGRSGYFSDPEGNVWEVAYLPGASFDERGALVWPF